jgi:uncharacterized protein (TIGR03086 family)
MSMSREDQMFEDLLDELNRALAAVDPLIAGIGAAQWSAPTPCAEWTVRDVVTHLVGVNRVHTALLRELPPPARGDNPLGDDPVATYRASVAAMLDAVRLPGALDRTAESVLGNANGAYRLRWRIADLLVHAWDLAQATGQKPNLSDDLVAESLVFVNAELADGARTGRFGPAQPIADDAPAIERLVAFSGRPVS